MKRRSENSNEGSAGGRERRLGRWAAAASAAVVVLSFAAILVALSGSTVDRTPDSAPDRAEQLRDLHHGAASQGLGVLLRAIALLIMVVVSLYLWDIVRRRDPALRSWVLWTGVLGPPLVAATTAGGFFALTHIADVFVNSGAHTAARANHLVNSSGPLRAVRLMEIVSRAIVGAWCAGMSYYAMRVGLLTRTLGVWGILAGAATLILGPIGDYLVLGWIASIGLLAYGYWPGEGRPPSWDAGIAIPWETVARPAASEGPD